MAEQSKTEQYITVGYLEIEWVTTRGYDVINKELKLCTLAKHRIRVINNY